jgi:hypothetical protein
VHGGRVERGPALGTLRDAVQDVVRDPVALVLARDDLSAHPVGVRVVGEQLAQQLARPRDVAPGCREELQRAGIGLRPCRPHRRNHRN